MLDLYAVLPRYDRAMADSAYGSLYQIPVCLFLQIYNLPLCIFCVSILNVVYPVTSVNLETLRVIAIHHPSTLCKNDIFNEHYLDYRGHLGAR
jgi:hypothetical protein